MKQIVKSKKDSMKKGLLLLLLSIVIFPFPLFATNAITVFKLRDEINYIVKEEEKLVREAKRYIAKRNILIEDIDRAIQKIDKGEITYCNEEIKTIKNKIFGWDDYDKMDNSKRNSKLLYRQTTVECELSESKLKNYLNGYIDNFNKVNQEWDSTMNEMSKQLNLYNDKVEEFYSKIDKLPVKTQ